MVETPVAFEKRITGIHFSHNEKQKIVPLRRSGRIAMVLLVYVAVGGPGDLAVIYNRFTNELFVEGFDDNMQPSPLNSTACIITHISCCWE